MDCDGQQQQESRARARSLTITTFGHPALSSPPSPDGVSPSTQLPHPRQDAQCTTSPAPDAGTNGLTLVRSAPPHALSPVSTSQAAFEAPARCHSTRWSEKQVWSSDSSAISGPSSTRTHTPSLLDRRKPPPAKYRKPPWLLRWRSARGFILTSVASAVFTDIFLYGIVIPILPFSLPDRAGVPQNSVQGWTSVMLAVYGAALMIGSPFFGWFADHTESRRAPLLFSLLLLGAATVLLVVATNVSLYVAGRLLQGLSSGIVWSVGCAMLVDTVGPDAIGEAMGYVTLAMTMGLIMAPFLGGIIFERSGYYAVFGLAFTLIAVDIFFRLFLIERKIAVRYEEQLPATQKDEEAGNILGGSILVAPEPPSFPGQDLIRHFSRTRSVGQTRQSSFSQTFSRRNTQITVQDEQALPSSVKAFVQNHTNLLHIALRRHEDAANARTTSQRLSRFERFKSRLPPFITLLASRRLLSALWGCLIQATIMTSFDSTLPLFVKTTFGWDSIGAGLIFLPIVIPTFASPWIGSLSDRYGPRYLAATGFLLALPWLVCLRFVTDNSMPHKVLLCALLALIGSSLTLAFPPLMAEITYVIAAKEKANPGVFGAKGAYAQAYGLFNFAFAGGCLVGPVWGGFVSERAGFGTMGWTLGLLSACTAIPTLVWAGGSIFKARRWRAAEELRVQGTTPENGESGAVTTRGSVERTGSAWSMPGGEVDWSEKARAPVERKTSISWEASEVARIRSLMGKPAESAAGRQASVGADEDEPQ